MYLAHHHPEDYDRCVRVGRSYVCRRCLVLYPLAAVTMLATLAAHPAAAVDVAVLVLLPLPAVIEVVLEQAGTVRHSPRRQVAVTVPLAIGLGRGFAIYLGDLLSPLFWGVVVGYTTICVVAVALGQRRVRRAPSEAGP